MRINNQALPETEFFADQRQKKVTLHTVLPVISADRAINDTLIELGCLNIDDDSALGQTSACAMPITKELGAFPQARMVLVVLRMRRTTLSELTVRPRASKDPDPARR